MKVFFLFWCFLSITYTFSQTCSTQNQQISLILSTQENQWWGLQDTFFSGYNLSYSLSDNQYFSILPPLGPTDDNQTFIQPANIIQSVALKSQQDGSWLNSFAFLNGSDLGYNVYWALGKAFQGLKSPQFNKITPLIESQKCFGLDFINSTEVVVDCFDPITDENSFWFVNLDSATKINGINSNKYTDVKERFIQVYLNQSYNDELQFQNTTLIYLGTPTSGLPQIFQNQSVLEVFEYVDGQLTHLSTLNNDTLSTLLGSVEYEFNLVQFKINQQTGQVYVFDALNQTILILSFQNGIWSLNDQIITDVNPLAFDLRYEVNPDFSTSLNIIVLYSNKYENYQLVNGLFQVQVVNTYINIAQVGVFSISSEFLIVQNIQANNITIFSINSGEILTESNSTQQQWLVNPDYNRLILFTDQYSQAWSFSGGQLQYLSQDLVTNSSTVDITLTATSIMNTQQQSCQVIIQLQVYNNNDTQLVNLTQDSPLQLPEFISQKTQINAINQVSGPNKQYSGGEAGASIILQSLVLQQLNIIDTVNYPEANNIVFGDTLPNQNDPNIFYQILQTANNYIRILSCKIEYYSANTQCDKHGEIEIDQSINSKAYYAFTEYFAFSILTLNSPYEIMLSSCYAGNCDHAFNWSYPTQKGQEITSFTYLKRQIWVVRAGIQEIDIYQSGYPFNKIYTVNSAVIKSLGYAGTWQPQRIFSNNDENQSTVFIDNNDNLILANYVSQLNLLAQIPYSLSKPQVSIAIAQDTFFIAETNDTSSLLQEYRYITYDDLVDVKLQKQVNLLWYEFQTPLQAEFSAENGYFFIRALDTQQQVTVLLVFQPNVSQRDVLYQVISLETLIPSTTSITFAPSGQQNMFIYLNTGSQQSSWSFLTYPSLMLTPAGQPDELVSKNVPLPLRISNFASSNSFTYLEEAVLFNTGSNILFNDEAFENQVLKAFQLRKSNAVAQIPIQSNWYQGTVLYFEIECEDCEDGSIQIQNVVDEQELAQPLFAVNDFLQLNENNLLAQSDSALWLLSEQGNLTKLLDYNITLDTTCSLMQIGDGGANIVSLCENSTSYYIHITECLSIDSCRDFDILALPNVTTVLDFAIIDTDTAINLVILNNYTNKSSSSESNIMTFAITFDEVGNGTLSILQVLDTTTLGLTSPSSMTYFSYQGSDGQTYYKFLFLDNLNGIFGYDGSIQNDVLNIKPNSNQNLNLSSFLGNSYYISKTTQFLQIKNYNYSKNASQLNSSIILTSTNVAHFGLLIELDISVAGSAPWTGASVNFQLNRYGGAQTANQLVIYDGQIIIPYKSNRSPTLITLCYYQIPKNPVNDTILNILGGTEYFVNDNEQLEYLPFIIAQTQAQQYILFTSTESYYNLNNQAGYPRVVISNPSKVQPQKIILSAYNEQILDKLEAQTILSFNFCNCSTLVQNLSLILATNENQWWGLQDVFFSGFNLSYSINDTTQIYFDIIPQIQAVDSGKIYPIPANIVQAVPLTQSINGAWLSSFAFLDYSAATGSNIFWAFGNTINGLQSPAFETVTPVVDNSQQCFGLDYINSSTVVVDCFNTVTNTNYFHFVSADAKVEIKGTNAYGYTNVTYRQIQVVRTEGISDEESVTETYIYRGTPTYGTSNTLAGDSVIEIFKIINENEISSLASLDAATLGQLLGLKDYQFNLVEFKLLNNGQLYVLDESGFLYTLQLNATTNKFILQADIDLENQQPYGIDVNQYIKQDGTTIINIVVLFSNNFVIYEWNDVSTAPQKVQETLTNEIISSYPGPTIQISQEYVLLQNIQTSTITLYTIDQDDILTQAKVQAQYWLVNPYQSNIIQFTGLSAKTWTFDQGQLIYNSVSKENKNIKAIQINATSISNSMGVDETQTCSVELEYRVYDQKSIELVEIDIETPIDLPEFIAQEYFSPVKTQISGPNQQYSAISKDVSIQSLVLNQLNIESEGVKYPNANDVLFVENIVTDLPPTLYQIIQTANKKIIILQCDLNEIFISTECKEIGNIEIDDVIQQKAFTAWSYYNFVIVATLNNPYALQIIDCTRNVCKTFQTISEANLPGNEFTAFSYQNSQLWIVLGNKKRIDVYNDEEFFEYAISIDQSMVKSQGLTDPWAPVNIFGSRYFNQNIVFIDNSISLIVASFNIQLSLLDQIKYNSIGPQVSIAVAANTFFIAESDGQTSYLSEYHFDKTSNIKLQKQLYLNWFVFSTPLQTDVSAENGNFFITAYDTLNKNTVILVYTPNTSQRDALYQVIPTGSNGNASLIMAAAGDKTAIIYLNNGTYQSTWSLQTKGYQQVAVVPQNIDELVSTSKITFQVANFQSGNTLGSQIQITSFNTQSSINFNDDVFNTQARRAFALKKTIQSKNIQLNSSWYQGAVLYFEIECEDCEDGLIQIQNVVDEQELAQPLFAVNDFLQLNENNLLAQSDSALWLLSEQGNLTKLLDYNITQDTTCSLMQIGYGGANIVSLCENSTSYYIHITECLSIDSCRVFDILALPNVTSVLDFAIIETYTAINLVILNNYTNKSSSSESNIMTFAITFDEVGNGTLSILQVLDTSTLGLTSPSSMTYFPYQGSGGQTYYKFLFLDNLNGIFIYDGSIISDKLSLNPVNTISLNLSQYLLSQGQYLSKVTKFLQIKQYSSSVTAQEQNVAVIVTTNNVAQFGLTIDFNGDICQYSIDFVLNRYGASLALNQLTILGNQVIIPYQSLAYPQTVTLCFYLIPLKSLLGQIPILNILGGAEIIVSSKSQMNYLPTIISTTSSGQNYPQVVITNTTKLNSQQIKLIAYNEQIRYLAEGQTVLNFILSDCQTNINSLNLILATNENQWWGLQDVFFTGFNLSYSINDTKNTKHLKIVDKLLSLDQSVKYKQSANIVQVVALQQENKEIWIYDFAFLDYSTAAGSNIFWAFGNTINGLQSPAFETVTPVVDNSQQCFGLDYINSSTIVVDCFNTVTNTNYFHFVSAVAKVEINGTNAYGYTNVTYRQIQVVHSKGISDEESVTETYIYRGTPTYGTLNTLAGDSVIEIFKVDNQSNISQYNVLGISQLRVLVKGIQNFDLVQFKVVDDILYVLDQNGYVYKLGLYNDQWQLYDTIQLNDQPFGFDVIYDINQYGGKSYNIVILFANRFDLYNWPGTYGSADFVLSYASGISVSTYPAPSIAFSQRYILLQNPAQNLITIFELNLENIVTQTQQSKENIFWLVNPFYHEIISLTATSAQAWSYSKGYLQFVSSDSVTDEQGVLINIQAQSIFNSSFGDETETCSVPLQLSVYDNKNPVIVQTSQIDPLSLPEFITVNYDTVLSNQFSGPNRQYQPVVQSKALSIESLSLAQIDISKTDIPAASNVIFADVIAAGYPSTIVYQIFQTTNNQVLFFQCDTSLYEASCLQMGYINITTEIQDKAFIAYNFYDYVFVGVLRTPYNISMYTCDYAFKCNNDFNLGFDSSDKNNAITSFVYQQNYLWIVQSGLNTVSIYRNEYVDFSLQLIINADLVKSQGYQDAWNPQAIYCNRNYDLNTVFIDNGINLIIADFNGQFTLLDQIKYDINNARVKVGVAQTTFFIAETDGIQSILHEYDYSDQHNIRFQKNHYLYNYTFTSNLIAELSPMNGYFFIGAENKNTQQSAVLVFAPNKSQRDALFYLIPTEKISDTTIISPSGDKNLYIYLNIEGKQSLWYMQTVPMIEFKPLDNDELVVQNIEFKINMINSFTSQSNVIYQNQTTVFNTKSNIIFNDETFSKSAAASFQILQSSGTTDIQIEPEWFSGQILKYEIDCNNCTGQDPAISIQNIVNKRKLLFNLDEIVDFAQDAKGALYAQTETNLWLINNKGQKQSLLNYTLNAGATCSLMRIGDDGAYILSLCSSYQQGLFIHVTKCQSYDSCQDRGILQLNNLTSIINYAVLENDKAIINLVILNNDQSSTDKNQSNIMIYVIQDDEQTGLNITLQKVIDTKSIGFTSPSSMTYFNYIANDQNSYYKFLFVDKVNGLFAFDGQITQGILTISDTPSNQLNLATQLKAQGQFISSSTQFNQINNYLTSKTSTTFTAKLIITTSNVAQFGLSLNFDIPANGFINNAIIAVDFTINRYGSAQTLNQLLVSKNTIIIPYKTAANQATFCQYTMQIDLYLTFYLNIKTRPKQQQLNFGLKASIPNLNILGGQAIDTNLQNQIPLILNNSQSLFTNQDYYDIYSQATILVSNSDQLQSQNLTLSAYNAQGGKPVTASASLVIKPQPQPQPTPDKKSLAWWAILLIVLGALAAIGLAFFLVKSCKKSSGTKVKEQLLTNSINQDFK